MRLLSDMSSARVRPRGRVSEGMRVAVRIEDLANLDYDVLWDRRLFAFARVAFSFVGAETMSRWCPWRSEWPSKPTQRTDFDVRSNPKSPASSGPALVILPAEDRCGGRPP
jgi:hypothetical protein